MIKQFSGATIWSEDLNNLLPFYRDVLGLKVASESPGFVLLGDDQPDVPALALGHTARYTAAMPIRRGTWSDSPAMTSWQIGSG
jgi:catechol-2,3-dioxygenase